MEDKNIENENNNENNNEETNNEVKKINITGTHNRYYIKKLLQERKSEKEIKKRVVINNWTFSDEFYSYEKQMKLIKDIFTNKYTCFDNVSKILIQEINKKIYSYKQQDVCKSRYDEKQFITLQHVIDKILDCELKCRYCNSEMFVLYDISREIKQWSVDRVNNDLGHNHDNFHLACLECNLKRRRRTDEKFLFTKQLSIIKMDN